MITLSFYIYFQDGDGRPSEFVTLLLQQYQQESKQFIQEIAQALAEKRYITSDLIRYSYQYMPKVYNVINNDIMVIIIDALHVYSTCS